jgi:hypothetical protein
MKRQLKWMVPAAIASALMVTACATTKLNSVWKNKNYEGAALEKVLVVGVSDNVRNRKIFEDSFAAKFTESGVTAVPSHEVLPTDEALTKESVKSKAQELGMTAVLVTHYVGTDTKTVYTPPSYDRMNMHPYYGRFDTYYPTVYSYVNQPGYYSEREYVKLESSLYDTQSEELVWSAESSTMDPETADQLIDSLGKAVMESLRKNGLLP